MIRQQPTPPAVKARIDALLDKLAPTVAYLHDRWQDERGYEDFAAYAQRIKASFAEADPSAAVLRVSRRPFGATFTMPDAPEGATYIIRATSRCVQWQRAS